MSNQRSFQKLGLDSEQFKVPKKIADLQKQLLKANEDNKDKAMEDLIKAVQKEVRSLEKKYDHADCYDDNEVMRYSSRMRSELMQWAKEYIDTSKIKLADL